MLRNDSRPLVLRNPDAGEGGGGAPATPPEPKAKTAATPPPAPDTADVLSKLGLTAEDIVAIMKERDEAKAEAARIAAEAKAEAEKKEADRIKALADKDGVAAALEEIKKQSAEEAKRLRDELEQLRGKDKVAAREKLVTEAILGVEFINPEAAKVVADRLKARVTENTVNGQVVYQDSVTGKLLNAEALKQIVVEDSQLNWMVKANVQPGQKAGDPSVRALEGQQEKAPETLGEAWIAEFKKKGSPGLFVEGLHAPR